MNKIIDIVNYLEELFPPAYQEKYDNSGFQISFDVNENCNGILLTLDVTQDALEEAIKDKLNFIISHHPLLYDPLKKIDLNSYTGKLINLSIKNQINIYSLHTNFDKSINGISSYIAKLLDLKNISILEKEVGHLKKLVTFVPNEYVDKVREAICNAGAGVIGNYDFCTYNIEGYGTFRAKDGANPFVGNIGELHKEPEIRLEVIFPSYLQQKVINNMLNAHPYEEVAYDIYPLDNKHPLLGFGVYGSLKKPMEKDLFLKFVKETLKVNVLKCNDSKIEKIQKIAICSGNGSFLLDKIINSDIDCYISSDFKYHIFVSFPKNKLLIDIGHFNSEIFFVDLIFEILSKKFNNFVIKKYYTLNPIKYF